MKSVILNTLALTLLLPLAACGRPDQADSQPASPATTAQAGDKAPSSWVARRVDDAMQQAKRELATKNIDVDTVHIGKTLRQGRTTSKAQITPQGDLLIDGEKVAATPEQHQMLLDYRQRIIDIAEAGMAIGTQGADLGMHAASAALSGVFSGKSDAEIEAAIKPQTDRIQAAALELCKRLPDLRAAQQQLATAMPAFKPYATMTQEDVQDCGKNISDHKKGVTVLSF
ncbi:MAG: hypothetical protein WBA65_13970 [Rhodanobacter sp.]|jgi:hypothetical protein